VSRISRAVVVAIVLLVAGAGVWLWTHPRTPPNAGLVLITIDTLRADRVGAYGSTAVRTPALDAIAADGIRFSAAYATVPLTLPSHASMLSGRLPVAHTVRTNDGYRVPSEVPLVAETLRQAGFRTAAFVGSIVLGSATGIDRGFETFDDDMGQKAERRCEEVVQRAASWLSTVGPDRYLLWVHMNDPHLPYDPPEPFASEYGASPYDAEVAYTDRCVGQLVADLDRVGVSDRSAVVVAADHGEGLGDHGERSHGVLLYDTTIRVPLLVRPPGGLPASTITTPVSLAQIAPTLIDLAHLPNGEQESSLLARGAGGGFAGAETLYAAQQLGWSPIYAARSGSLKVIDAPAPQLYDLERDPSETRNLASADPASAARLRDRLQREMEAAARSAATPAASAVDPESTRKLASLGYASGSGTVAAGVVGVGGPDPHARLDVWEDDERGLEFSNRGEHAAAATVFESVLRRDPANALALKFLGAAALEQGDLRRAIEYNERVAASGLHQADVLSNLAIAYLRGGRVDAALATARKAVSAGAQHRAARSNLVLVLETIGSTRARAGDDAGAAAAFREAAGVDPSNLDVAERLAAVLHRSGRLDEARAIFQSVLARDAQRLTALLSLAVLDLEAGRLEIAIAALERIPAQSPGAYRAAYYLGEAYRRRGDLARAREAYARCVSTAPPGDPIAAAARVAAGSLR
jgi:arylsulfatase A-like enzyme/Tfp pilus assembly protein PilF